MDSKWELGLILAAMEARIQKWVDSLALRIPNSFATRIHLERGPLVELSLRDGRLIIEPLHLTPMTLEDLLKDVTVENLHNEVDTGPAVGSEMW